MLSFSQYCMLGLIIIPIFIIMRTFWPTWLGGMVAGCVADAIHDVFKALFL